MPDRIVTWAAHGRARIGPKQIFLIITGFNSPVNVNSIATVTASGNI